MTGKRKKPVTYSDDVAELVCALVASGMPVTTIEKRSGMPASATIYAWRAKYKDFGEKFDAAQEGGSRGRMEAYELLAVKALEGKIKRADGNVMTLQERDMLARNYTRLAGLVAGTLIQKRRVEGAVSLLSNISDDEVRRRYEMLTASPAPVILPLEGHA